MKRGVDRSIRNCCMHFKCSLSSLVIIIVQLTRYSCATGPFRAVSSALRMSTKPIAAPIAWDEKLGVWVGERAPAVDMAELSDPLYILGYGSLIWRPGALLENLKTYKCTALGSMRLFAQRSCDHRGTPEFPGLVLNLVNDSVLEELGYRTSDMPGSEFRGLVWHVPTSDVTAVIEDLDYRERGGYHRHIIPVRLDQGPNGRSEVVNALVYTGAPSNPNFYLPPSTHSTHPTAPTAPSSASSTTTCKIDFFNLCKRNIMTDTIAAAVGPSGPNVDYLCNLEAFLNKSDMHDPFLTDLATSVRLRLGIWRGRLYRGERQAIGEKQALREEQGGVCGKLPFQLLGWGSNEFLQLSNNVDDVVYGGKNVIEKTEKKDLLGHRYRPTDVSSSLPPALRSASTTSPAVSKSLQEDFPPPSDTTTKSSDGVSDKEDPLHLAGLEERFVVAGGGTSAVLCRGCARIFGSLVPDLLECVHRAGDVVAGNVASEGGTAVSDELRQVLETYNHSIVIDNIEGVAIGHHMLLLHRRPLSPRSSTTTSDDDDTVRFEDVIITLGSDSHGQCSAGRAAAEALGVRYLTSSELVLKPNSDTGGASFLVSVEESGVIGGTSADDIVPTRILKLAVGQRHSAAITTSGVLVTWGDSKHGQCLSPTVSSWKPPSGAKLVDVACGAKFTVVVDDLGVVYQLGSPFGASGCDSSSAAGVPVAVEGLPEDVRWQRVTCGWSHTVLRGLTASMDRKLVFCAWGKQNLSQYITDPAGAPQTESTVGTSQAPRRLAPLPRGHSTVEVWCGSEYTIAADETGGLWACGWNEHGNLGVGAPETKSSDSAVVGEWRRVGASSGSHHESRLSLSHVWEGALACGGAHVLCLP